MEFILQTLEYFPFLLQGAGWTLGVSIAGMVGGSIIAVLMALARDSRFRALRWTSGLYIDFIRITPLFVQLLWVYYALPMILGWSLTGLQAGVLGLSLSTGAYLAEVVRAGIHSVPSGEKEAALALGMSHRLVMVRVVLPQALVNMLPAVGNIMIMTIKASSLLSVVAVSDLLRSSQVISSVLQREFEPLVVAAVMYVILTLPVSLAVAGLEKRRRARA